MDFIVTLNHVKDDAQLLSLFEEVMRLIGSRINWQSRLDQNGDDSSIRKVRQATANLNRALITTYPDEEVRFGPTHETASDEEWDRWAKDVYFSIVRERSL